MAEKTQYLDYKGLSEFKNLLVKEIDDSVPKKTSQLVNDNNFVTEDDVEKQIADGISKTNHLNKEIIDEETKDDYVLNPEKANINTIYLVKDSFATGNDKYYEYQKIGTEGNYSFEMTGDTSTDLSNYYTKSQIDSELGDYVPKVGTTMDANAILEWQNTDRDKMSIGVKEISLINTDTDNPSATIVTSKKVSAPVIEQNGVDIDDIYLKKSESVTVDTLTNTDIDTIFTDLGLKVVGGDING